MAHIGVGAFHRCHQAEFTDDALEARFDRWGVVGINIRPPRLADTLGRQDGIYTRLLRDGDQRRRPRGRLSGGRCRRQDSSDAAVSVLETPGVDVVTITATEKGYCHQPATGEIDAAHPDIVHDLAHPDAAAEPAGADRPGAGTAAAVARAADHLRLLRQHPVERRHPRDGGAGGGGTGAGRTSCAGSSRTSPFPRPWSTASCRRPRRRTSPSSSARYGYRDSAVVVGEPFRQWVIEDRFAGRTPPWALAGATFVDDVTPFELIKMRVLNAAQTSFAYLGLIAGHEHTSDDMTDPVLTAIVRRMLIEESLPTLPPVPGVDPLAYLDLSFGRLRNTAIRHRNHQIATDGSRKIVQRILNPIRERLETGGSVERLTLVVAAWMLYLVSASKRFGERWTVEDPFAAEAARHRRPRRPRCRRRSWTGSSPTISIFDRALAGRPEFRSLGRAPSRRLAVARPGRLCSGGSRANENGRMT